MRAPSPLGRTLGTHLFHATSGDVAHAERPEEWPKVAGFDVSGLEKLLEYHGSMLILRVVLHVTIFAAAVLIFTLGLGVGLALNSAAGTFLWLVAGVLAVGNVVWIVRRLRGRPDRGPQEDA